MKKLFVVFATLFTLTGCAGMGPMEGAVVGGMIGHQVGQGNGRSAATIGGVVVGAMAGAAMQQQAQQGGEEAQQPMDPEDARVIAEARAAKARDEAEDRRCRLARANYKSYGNDTSNWVCPSEVGGYHPQPTWGRNGANYDRRSYNSGNNGGSNVEWR